MADDLFPARPEDVDRRVIIEWPQALNGAAFACWAVSVTDAVTGEPVNAVSKMALHFDAEDLLWADALAFVGKDGHMLTGTEGRLATDDEGRVRRPCSGSWSRRCGPGSAPSPAGRRP